MIDGSRSPLEARLDTALELLDGGWMISLSEQAALLRDLREEQERLSAMVEKENLARISAEFDKEAADAAIARLTQGLQVLIAKWLDISGRPNRPTGFRICADELQALLAPPAASSS